MHTVVGAALSLLLIVGVAGSAAAEEPTAEELSAAEPTAAEAALVPLYGALGDEAPQESVRVTLERAELNPQLGTWLQVVADVAARDEASGRCRAIRRLLPASVPGEPVIGRWDVSLRVELTASDACPEGPLTGLVGPVGGRAVVLSLEGARIAKVFPANPAALATELSGSPWERWPPSWEPPAGWTLFVLADGRLELEADAQVVVRFAEDRRAGRQRDGCDACTCFRPLIRVDTGDPSEMALVVALDEEPTSVEVPCAHMPNFEGHADLGVLPAGLWTFPAFGQVTVAVRAADGTD